MKRFFLMAGLMLLSACVHRTSPHGTIPETVTLTKEVLQDKIKGGWAGQAIGCTYGGPTEFRFQGTMINDYHPIGWSDGCMKSWYQNSPGLYDDVYMDLTFVEVFERLGLDAPADSFAMAFATADYGLWHANQVARTNILNGIMPPASGHWLNNPHADDIDYQIEADYAGLMCPGMPNSASEISDRIGHIMCYGDGWYGGVYVGAMYSLAFISDDLEFIVTEALKTIPEQSRFHQCISDVIRWWKQYPEDWKQTWFECEKKWDVDYGCPEGTFRSYNIDAVINSAYVVIGLLYGEGDFFRTIDIATRCGQDSDCNPATAAGILGTMIGYSRIPEFWMKSLHEVEDMPLAYTDISLNRAYALSFGHALQMIEREGGTVQEDQVTIVCQQPSPVAFEQGFEGHYPVASMWIHKPITDVDTIRFEGIGVVIVGNVQSPDRNYVAEVEVHLDGAPVETVRMPADSRKRRLEVFWRYRLPKGQHYLTFNWKNPMPEATLSLTDGLVYSDAPAPALNPY